MLTLAFVMHKEVLQDYRKEDEKKKKKKIEAIYGCYFKHLPEEVFLSRHAGNRGDVAKIKHDPFRWPISKQ